MNDHDEEREAGSRAQLWAGVLETLLGLLAIAGFLSLLLK